MCNDTAGGGTGPQLLITHKTTGSSGIPGSRWIHPGNV